jgi:hypothetical protein
MKQDQKINNFANFEGVHNKVCMMGPKRLKALMLFYAYGVLKLMKMPHIYWSYGYTDTCKHYKQLQTRLESCTSIWSTHISQICCSM